MQAIVLAPCIGFNAGMLNKLPFFIALRHIRGKQGNGFATFISWLSFLAMTLGVAALIIVLSVMNGFNGEIRHRILEVIPHAELNLERDQDWQPLLDELRKVNEVTAVAPVIEGYAMLSNRGTNRGTLLQGVDPALEHGVTGLDSHMKDGSLDQLHPGAFGIVLGSILARGLGVTVGDSVLLSLPELNVTPLGVFPRFKRFRVVGIFGVGAQVDDGLAFIHLKDAQKIYRIAGGVDGIRIRSVDPLHPEKLKKAVHNHLGDTYQVTGWQDRLQTLFAAIRMEKLVVGVLLSSVIVVATFNIVASLVLMVASKRKDIAVLRTLGADLPVIYRLVIYQGALLGVGGVIAGSILGALIAVNIGTIVSFMENITGLRIFDPDVYFIAGLPSELAWVDVAVIATAGVLLSILATLYPAKRAGNILPAEALRYDH